MKSCITLSLVPNLRGGPWILWDDLPEGFRKASEFGFDSVELFTDGPNAGHPGQLKSLLKDFSLSLGAVGTGAGKVLHGLTLTSSEKSIRKKAKAFISEMIQFGAEFGAPAIIGSMQGNWSSENPRMDAIDQLSEALIELGEEANKNDTFLIYEPLNRYETNLFNRCTDAADFLRNGKISGVRLLADLFHMNIEEENISESIRYSFDFLGHVHFADSNRRPVGNGHLDIQPIAKTLIGLGYEGFISAEAFDWPTPDQAAIQTIKSFNRFFRSS